MPNGTAQGIVCTKPGAISGGLYVSEIIWNRFLVTRRLFDHLHGAGGYLQRDDITIFIPKEIDLFTFADRHVFPVECPIVGNSNSIASDYSAAIFVCRYLRVIQLHSFFSHGVWRIRRSNLSSPNGISGIGLSLAIFRGIIFWWLAR
ncbi:MAG: hypothetical protein ACLGG1_08590 [Gammaproteobacteria bacterium]